MGIATTGEPPPELVERLEPEGKDSRRIAAWARDVFNKLESQALTWSPIEDMTFSAVSRMRRDAARSRSDTPLVSWRHATGIDVLVRRYGYESEEYIIMTIDGVALTERTRMPFGGL